MTNKNKFRGGLPWRESGCCVLWLRRERGLCVGGVQSSGGAFGKEGRVEKRIGVIKLVCIVRKKERLFLGEEKILSGVGENW